MASRHVHTLVDDLDGEEATETVAFGLDGDLFEIDLSDQNAAELRALLADFIKAARKLGKAKAKGGGARVAAVESRDYDPRDVRQWAADNGVTLPARGRISAVNVAAYREQDVARLAS